MGSAASHCTIALKCSVIQHETTGVDEHCTAQTAAAAATVDGAIAPAKAPVPRLPVGSRNAHRSAIAADSPAATASTKTAVAAVAAIATIGNLCHGIAAIAAVARITKPAKPAAAAKGDRPNTALVFPLTQVAKDADTAISPVAAVAAIAAVAAPVAAVAPVARIAKPPKATAATKGDRSNAAHANPVHSGDRPPIGSIFIAIASNVNRLHRHLQIRRMAQANAIDIEDGPAIDFE